jgi:hypothetical protein
MGKDAWGDAKVAKLTGKCSLNVRTLKDGALSGKDVKKVAAIGKKALTAVMMVLGYLNNPKLHGKQKTAVDAAAKKYFKCDGGLTGADLDLVRTNLTKIQNGLEKGHAGLKVHDMVTKYGADNDDWGRVNPRAARDDDPAEKVGVSLLTGNRRKRGDIHLHSTLLQPDYADLAVLTLIHESSHRFADRRDHPSVKIGERTGEVKSEFTKDDALSDADCLAWFVVMAHKQATAGRCYLTTATCGALLLPDDCHELTTLRWFRDAVLLADPDGRRDVAEYYATAPTVVAAIDRSADPESVYESVYAGTIAPAVAAIERGEFDRAYRLYKDLVAGLRAAYLPRA